MLIGVEPGDVVLHVALSPLLARDIPALLDRQPEVELTSRRANRARNAARARAAAAPSLWLGERPPHWSGGLPPPLAAMLHRLDSGLFTITSGLVEAMAAAAALPNGTPWQTADPVLVEGFLGEHVGDEALTLVWSRLPNGVRRRKTTRSPDYRRRGFWGAQIDLRHGKPEFFRLGSKAEAVAWLAEFGPSAVSQDGRTVRKAWMAPRTAPPSPVLAFRARRGGTGKEDAMLLWLERHGRRL